MDCVEGPVWRSAVLRAWRGEASPYLLSSSSRGGRAGFGGWGSEFGASDDSIEKKKISKSKGFNRGSFKT